MDINKFLKNTELKNLLTDVDKLSGKEFSNIIDDAGNQYVDLVLEGGGMLGIALVGYIYVLEHANIRFRKIGGASAGSINAILLAALGKSEDCKAIKMLKEISNKNFLDLLDGDDDVVDFIDTYFQSGKSFKLAFKAIQVLDNLNENLGLCEGENFFRWISDLLENEGISTVKNLQDHMNRLPQGLRIRGQEPLPTGTSDIFGLAIIASDISTESKIEFPKMAELFWTDPEKINPAKFVRASMSIPFIFRPLVLKDLPSGDTAVELWKFHTGYNAQDEGGTPTKATFIDGGIMSNFPIDIFHDYKNIPNAPTFGVKLELDKRKKEVENPIQLLAAIFNSSRHTLDYDFIHRNPDYTKLVTWIPAEGFDWLDFNMSEENKVKLFIEGAKSAKKFLETFNWADYRLLREGTKAEAIVSDSH